MPAPISINYYNEMMTMVQNNFKQHYTQTDLSRDSFVQLSILKVEEEAMVKWLSLFVTTLISIEVKGENSHQISVQFIIKSGLHTQLLSFNSSILLTKNWIK